MLGSGSRRPLFVLIDVVCLGLPDKGGAKLHPPPGQCRSLYCGELGGMSNVAPWREIARTGAVARIVTVHLDVPGADIVIAENRAPRHRSRLAKRGAEATRLHYQVSDYRQTRTGAIPHSLRCSFLPQTTRALLAQLIRSIINLAPAKTIVCPVKADNRAVDGRGFCSERPLTECSQHSGDTQALVG